MSTSDKEVANLVKDFDTSKIEDIQKNAVGALNNFDANTAKNQLSDALDKGDIGKLSEGVDGMMKDTADVDALKNQFDAMISPDQLSFDKDLDKIIQDTQGDNNLKKFISYAIPAETWKGISRSILDKVCESIRDARTDGASIKLEMIELVNKVLTITIREMNFQKFKLDIEREIKNKMKGPMDKLFNSKNIQMNAMNNILLKNKEIIIDFIENYLNSDHVKSKMELEKKRTIFDFINYSDINDYINDYVKMKETMRIEGNVDENPEVDASQIVKSPDTVKIDDKSASVLAPEPSSIIDEETPTNTNVQKGGGVRNDGDDVDKDDDASRIVKSPDVNRIDKEPTSVSTDRIEDDENSSEKKSKSMMSTGNSRMSMGDINNVFGTLREMAEIANVIIASFEKLIGTMVFYNLKKGISETEDENADKPLFVEDMHTRITHAAAYHLEKPEGRQMYLRNFNPLLKDTINTITGIDVVIIPLFINCLQLDTVSRIIAEINNEMDYKEATKEKIQEFIELLQNQINEYVIKNDPLQVIYSDLKEKKIPKDTIDRKKQIEESSNASNKSISDRVKKSDAKKNGAEQEGEPFEEPQDDVPRTVKPEDVPEDENVPTLAKPENTPVESPEPVTVQAQESQNRIDGGKKSRNQKYLPKKRNITRRKK
jgi:hypothetical protein